MDDETITDPEAPAAAADADPPDEADGSQETYRAPRWAWFVLGGLAVVAIAFAVTLGGRDVLFEDDFSASGALGRWLEDENSMGSMGYEAETYHVGVARQGEMISVADLPGRRSSIRIGVDAEMVSGTGGLSVLCIAESGAVAEEIQAVSEQAEYYDFFLYFSQGAVAILRPDRPDAPLAVASTGLLHDGMNHVEVGCTGASGSEPAKLTVSVNGTPLLEHADPGGSDSFSAVGLTVYGDEGAAEAAFDNLEVSEL